MIGDDAKRTSFGLAPAAPTSIPAQIAKPYVKSLNSARLMQRLF
jgi:hypothetical protein